MDAHNMNTINPSNANVPFGNSIFQIQHFTDGKETPERRYRHCMLQLNQKYTALKECEFRRKRYDIDIEEINEKMESAEGFERRRLEIDLEEKEHYLSIEVKMIEDCLVEVATYNQILSELPDFTRQEFEKAEPIYWQKRLLDDARREMLSIGTVSVGTIQAIESTGIRIGKNEEGQITYELGEPNNDNILRIDTTDNI